MADVVLIFPKIPHLINDRPPLGTLYLAAVLKENGFSVTLIDETVQKNARELLEKSLGPETLLVGVSTTTGPQINGALNVAKFIRERRPDIPIVWGGCHPTVDPLGTVSSKFADAVCIGEGEEAIVEMAKASREGKPFSGVRGLAIKENGAARLTAPRTEYFDLNTLPPLPYGLIDMDFYAKAPEDISTFWGFRSERLLSLETSRGCPFSCAYCLQSAKDEKFRRMSPETTMRFLGDIVSQGVTGVTILDDNFFSNPKQAARILESICEKNWGLKIFVAVRADYLNRIKQDSISLMKRAGVLMLGIGVESGSNKILKMIDKHETIETTFDVSRKLAKAGIYSWYHFLSGYPGETLDDTLATYRAMTRILKTNKYARVSHNKLMAYPRTPIYEECVKHGLNPDKTLEQWSDVLDPNWEKDTSYIDKDVVNWSKNTKYYIDLVHRLSLARVPETTREIEKKRRAIEWEFRFWSKIMALRIFFKTPGEFIDNRIQLYLLTGLEKNTGVLRRIVQPWFFNSKFRRSVAKETERPRKVLVIGSSRTWHIVKIVECLLDLWKCEVGFLCGAHAVDDYRKRFNEIHYMTTDSSRFLDWNELEESVKREMNGFSPDIVIIPTMERNRERMRNAYNNILDIASRINAKATCFVNSEGEFFFIDNVA